jgi:hypothetical protein
MMARKLKLLLNVRTRELDKLKDKLPRGYRIELWKRTGCSIAAIDAVLRGNYNNTTIIDAAILLAEEHQNELKSRSEKINML